MIDKNERVVTRARYTEKFPQGYQYSQARVDVIGLLDALDESYRENAELHKSLNTAIDMCGDAAFGKGSWKTRAAMLETDLINANLNLQIMTERVAALEKLSRGRCDVCVHKNESMTDADSPCFEMGLTCRDGYFPECEHWEIDEAVLTTTKRSREGLIRQCHA